MPRKPVASPVEKKRRHVRRTVEPSLKLVGKALREARKQAGYSQESFAAEAGLDRSYWGMVERGLVNIGVLVLFEVAQVLGRDPGTLLPSLQDVAKRPKARS
jgi:transcriptional regulator with XRE-family HTH domain